MGRPNLGIIDSELTGYLEDHLLRQVPSTNAKQYMSHQFTPDPELEKMAQAFARAAVDFSAEHFHLALDYSDTSIQYIEGMLDQFHRGLASAAPPEEKIEQYSKMFGSYLGETFRLNHAGSWGAVASGSEKIPSMRSDRAGTIFHPLTLVYQRLTGGGTEDVYRYYHSLVEEVVGLCPAVAPAPALPQQGTPPTDPPPKPEVKKSFWKRFFGR